MSAFVVNKTHIDLLVRAAIQASRPNNKFSWWQVDAEGKYAGWRELDEYADGSEEDYWEHKAKCSPSRLGQILVSENVASVSYRYPDDNPEAGDLPGPIDAYYMAPYVYEDPRVNLNAGQVFAAIDCLDYQSCEHPGWETSEAYALLRSLRDAYCRKVEGYGGSPLIFDLQWVADQPQDTSISLMSMIKKRS